MSQPQSGNMPPAQGNLQAMVRHNYAVPHLLGAARFARGVARVELEHRGELFAAFFDDIRADATACVMLAAASLDAYANELFRDWKRYLPTVSDSEMEAIWAREERRSILNRFDTFLGLLGAGPLVRTDSACRDIEALLGLRNALVHFTPERSDERVRHEEISAMLDGRFERSVFLPNIEAEPLFPIAWASSSCSTWVVRSCRTFASELSRLSEIEDKFGKFADRLTTD